MMNRKLLRMYSHVENGIYILVADDECPKNKKVIEKIYKLAEEVDDANGNINDEENSENNTISKGPTKQITYTNSKPTTDKIPQDDSDEQMIITKMVELMKDQRPPKLSIDIHTESMGEYRCVFCGCKSKTERESLWHYRRSHGERYLRCICCDMTFRFTSTLYSHERICKAQGSNYMRQARRKILGLVKACRICGLELRRQDVSLHEKMHDLSDKKIYKCTYCPASFAQKITLENHIRSHRGERPFRCESCPRAYSSRKALYSHRLTHNTGVNVCDICDKQFTTKGNLDIHRRRHTDPKPFLCNTCGARYVRKAALKLHSLIHEGLPRPVPCVECNLRFSDMTQLKKHMKKVHGMGLVSQKMFLDALPLMADSDLPDTSRPFQMLTTRNNDDES